MRTMNKLFSREKGKPEVMRLDEAEEEETPRMTPQRKLSGVASRERNSFTGEASEMTEAIRAALRILGFRDQPARILRDKLKQRGFSSDAVERAVSYVSAKGYLNEERMLEAEIRTLAVRKHYGRMRILSELRQKGYAKETLETLSPDCLQFAEYDFIALCREWIEKTGGAPDEKTVASLRRRGYTLSEIKAAFGALREKDE